MFTSFTRAVDKLLKRRPSSYPYISGDSFRAIAQHVYEGAGSAIDPSRIQEGEIVFIQADMVRDFMATIHTKIAVRYIVITHNATDTVIDASYAALIDEPNILRWYAQNAAIEHPKLIPLPAGLENMSLHHEGETSFFDALRSANLKGGAFKKFRIVSFEALEENPMMDNAQAGPGMREKVNGYAMLAALSLGESDSKEIWQAMYLGALPIVKRSHLMEYYRSLGLPIWIVDSWGEVPRDVKALRERYDIIWATVSGDALWMDYWIKEIKRSF